MTINRRFVVATAAAAMTLFTVSFAEAAHRHHTMTVKTNDGKEVTLQVMRMHGQEMVLVPMDMAPHVFFYR